MDNTLDADANLNTENGASQIDTSANVAPVDRENLLSSTIDNQARYVLDEQGNPVMNSRGKLKMKPGRPKKIIAGSSPSEPVAAAKRVKTKLDVEANRAAAVALATSILTMAIGTMSALVGDEWQCESQDEADGLKGALATYIEAKGEAKLSPEWMLALVVGSYAIPRLRHANTRSKLGSGFAKIWGLAKSGFRAIF